MDLWKLESPTTPHDRGFVKWVYPEWCLIIKEQFFDSGLLGWQVYLLRERDFFMVEAGQFLKVIDAAVKERQGVNLDLPSDDYFLAIDSEYP
jgi:hypothetical protein